MDIIIGREEHASEPRLRLIVEGKEKFLATQTQVPKTVSRRHCVLSVNGDEITVTNMKEGVNPIYVNGQEVERKRIRKDDKLQLGNEMYSIDVAAILSALNNNDDGSVSIAHLEKVYNDYLENKDRLSRMLSLKNNISRFASVLLLATGMMIKSPAPEPGQADGVDLLTILRWSLLAISLIMALLGFSDVNNSKKQRELHEQFLNEYECPKCGKSFGNMRYKDLAKYVACPSCKTKFKH